MEEKIIFITFYKHTEKWDSAGTTGGTRGHNLPTPFQEVQIRAEPVIFLCLMFTVIPTSSSKTRNTQSFLW